MKVDEIHFTAAKLGVGLISSRGAEDKWQKRHWPCIWENAVSVPTERLGSTGRSQIRDPGEGREDPRGKGLKLGKGPGRLEREPAPAPLLPAQLHPCTLQEGQGTGSV